MLVPRDVRLHQSLITPVGGFTMVANVFFAHFWLKEALKYV